MRFDHADEELIAERGSAWHNFGAIDPSNSDVDPRAPAARGETRAEAGGLDEGPGTGQISEKQGW
jgi:hypothetical protein